MADAKPLLFVPVGDNDSRPFGMAARDYALLLAGTAGFEGADDVQPGRSALLASMDYCWDPAWLTDLSGRPQTILTLGGKPVIANVPPGEDGAAAKRALEQGEMIEGYAELAAETAEPGARAPNRGGPAYLLRLDPFRPVAAERASFDAAYKKVTDALSSYLLKEPAFHLTRGAAHAGLRPNLVTIAGALSCALTFLLFWRSDYWLGLLSGLAFMTLDIVDGELARCTAATSRLGAFLDQAIDLVQPPLWWWAWLHGLSRYGRPLDPFHSTMVLLFLIGGYAGQRIIEGLSSRRFDGMEIHAWRPLDSRFRLIGAGRNTNMVILSIGLAFRRPDVGLELVAWWTLVSVIFHAVRLAQMTELKARGQRIVSWLEA